MQIICGSQFGRTRETTEKKRWRGGHRFSEEVEEGKGTPAENIFLPQILYRHPTILPELDVCGSVHRSMSHRKSDKMQQCIKILFHIYMKLNMFRATHSPSPGA